MISIIVAHDEHLAIGFQQWMPWNLPEDLKHFRQITMHQEIVMGRVTFQAMKKPLPNRHTYIVTQDKSYVFEHEDVTIIHDFIQLMKRYQNTDETLYICGGANVYQQALSFANEMWISLVDGKHEADTFFPEYDISEFDVNSKEMKDGFTILHYIRKK